jgi:hypothetical protein
MDTLVVGKIDRELEILKMIQATSNNLQTTVDVLKGVLAINDKLINRIGELDRRIVMLEVAAMDLDSSVKN